MRIGEVNAMQYDWIDENGLRINLPAEYTKTKKARSIPIDVKLLEEIKNFKAKIEGTNLDNDKYLFFNHKTNSHEKNSFKAFSNAVDRAKLSTDINRSKSTVSIFSPR